MTPSKFCTYLQCLSAKPNIFGDLEQKRHVPRVPLGKFCHQQKQTAHRDHPITMSLSTLKAYLDAHESILIHVCWSELMWSFN